MTCSFVEKEALDVLELTANPKIEEGLKRNPPHYDRMGQEERRVEEAQALLHAGQLLMAVFDEKADPLKDSDFDGHLIDFWRYVAPVEVIARLKRQSGKERGRALTGTSLREWLSQTCEREQPFVLEDPLILGALTSRAYLKDSPCGLDRLLEDRPTLVWTLARLMNFLHSLRQAERYEHVLADKVLNYLVTQWESLNQALNGLGK